MVKHFTLREAEALYVILISMRIAYKEGEYEFKTEAICAHVHNKVPNGLNHRYKMWAYTVYPTWKYYSGDCVYPVPESFSKLEPKVLARYTYEASTFPWIGSYGHVRADLLQHLITAMESEMSLLRSFTKE